MIITEYALSSACNPATGLPSRKSRRLCSLKSSSFLLLLNTACAMPEAILWKRQCTSTSDSYEWHEAQRPMTSGQQICHIRPLHERVLLPSSAIHPSSSEITSPPQLFIPHRRRSPPLLSYPSLIVGDHLLSSAIHPSLSEITSPPLLSRESVIHHIFEAHSKNFFIHSLCIYGDNLISNLCIFFATRIQVADRK